MIKENQNINKRRGGLFGCLSRLIRYRVIEEPISETKTLFRPQFRYPLLPIWFNYWTSHTGHDCSNLYFATLEAAEEHNRNEAKLRGVVGKKKIHLPNKPMSHGMEAKP